MSDTILDRRPSTQLAIVFMFALLIPGCAKEKKSDPQFTAGRQALMRGQFEPAIEQFGNYLQQQPSGRLASRASFLTAKAYLGQGNYQLARQQFEHTRQQYGNSEEAHKSRYKLAMLSLIEGNTDDARQRFGELTAQPSGTLVPEASAMLRYLDAEDREADSNLPAEAE